MPGRYTRCVTNSSRATIAPVNPMNCPPLDELRAYAQGAIPDDLAEIVSRHLEECADCSGQMSSLEQEGDWLREVLRAERSVDFSDEKELQAILTVPVSNAAIPPQPDQQSPLRILGPYRLMAKLGQGGMGTVYEAVHEKLRRTVAVKLLPSHALGDVPAVARFEQEMAAVGTLDSPYIVRAHDAGQIEGEPFLAMEFVAGLNVAQLIERLGPLPPAAAAEIARQTALGLQYVHEQGLVHRDLKPSNLMVTPQGQVKMLDLGLARLHTAAGLPELTTSQQTMGTPDYLAPEQIHGSHDVDIRADLYGLGCTLFTLLAGRPPFADAQHSTPVRKLWGHVNEPPPDLQQLSPTTPTELTAIVNRLLAKRPADRFAKPQYVADALGPLAKGHHLSALVQRTTGTNRTDLSSPAIDTDPGRSEVSTGPTESWRKQSTLIPKRAWSGIRWPWAVAISVTTIACAILAGVIYVVTDQGTLKIETVDDSVQVVVSQNGKEIDIIDLKEKKTVKLQSGVYRLKLAKGKPGLHLESDSVRLVRGKEAVATITRTAETASAPPATSPPPALPGPFPQATSKSKPKRAPTPAEEPEVEGYSLTLILGPTAAFRGTGTWCTPDDMNEQGIVVGTFSNLKSNRMFTWENGRMQELNTPQDKYVHPQAINWRGEIVGTVVTKTTPAISTPFRYEDGLLKLLAPEGVHGFVQGMNAHGVVIGELIEEDKGRKAIAIQDGEVKLLPVPPGTTTASPKAINSRGQIACGFVAERNGKKTWRTCLIDQNEVIEIDFLEGCDFALTEDINEAGAIVGSQERTNGLQRRRVPFLFENGKVMELPLPAGMTTGWASKINASGQIIGHANVADNSKSGSHLFLYENGVVRDLHPKEWLFSQPVAINDRGQILGKGTKPGEGHFIGFLLTPLTPPALSAADATVIEAANDYDTMEIGPFNNEHIARPIQLLENGDVLAYSHQRSSGREYASFYWERESQSLTKLGEIRASRAIVGPKVLGSKELTTQQYEQVVFEDGALRQINKPAGVSKMYLRFRKSDGAIVGYYIDSAKKRQHFELVGKELIPWDGPDFPDDYFLQWENDQGLMLGRDAAAGTVESYQWDGSRVTPIPSPLGFKSCRLFGQNGRGLAVGHARTPGPIKGSSTIAVYYENGQTRAYPAPHGLVDSTAYDVNVNGQAIGTGKLNGKDVGLLFERDRVRRLVAESHQYLFPDAIHDSGVILCQAHNRETGLGRPVLLITKSLAGKEWWNVKAETAASTSNVEEVLRPKP
jgi:serine/threonine protein kinase/uncharacterized membrane protein